MLFARLCDRKEEIMVNLGPTELILILVIIILLFGVGRISNIAGEMGSAIRAFRTGIQGGEKEKGNEKEKTTESSETEPETPD
jgi:sec-independent protein translocase protein TatA